MFPGPGDEPVIRQQTGQWQPLSLKEWVFRKALQTDEGGAELRIHFTGPAVNIPLLQHAWSGIVELSLDDGETTELDLYSTFPISTVCRVEPGGSDDAEHTIKVRVTGRRNPAAYSAKVLVGQPTSGRAVAHSPTIPLTRSVTMRAGAEGLFLLLNADVGVSWSVMADGVWAEKDVALFKSLIRPGDVVFDIGSNIGHHAVVYSKLVGPRGQVHAFEPQCWIFKVLCGNLLVNDCINVHPHRLALGERPGRLRFPRLDYQSQTNFGAAGLSTIYQLEGESVPILTLDAFVREEEISRIDFMKLDVQTFELFVLRGAVDTLRRFRPMLFLEISPYWMHRMNGYDYREIYRLMTGMGYRLLDSRLVPIDPDAPPVDISDPEAAEWDVVAMPAEEVARWAA